MQAAFLRAWRLAIADQPQVPRCVGQGLSQPADCTRQAVPHTLDEHQGGLAARAAYARCALCGGRRLLRLCRGEQGCAHTRHLVRCRKTLALHWQIASLYWQTLQGQQAKGAGCFMFAGSDPIGSFKQACCCARRL